MHKITYAILLTIPLIVLFILNALFYYVITTYFNPDGLDSIQLGYRFGRLFGPFLGVGFFVLYAPILFIILYLEKRRKRKLGEAK